MPPDPSEVRGPDPDAIAAQTFTRSRKGFEVDEVRAFLVAMSSQVREAQRQHADVARRLAEMERRGADPRDLEVAEVSELLGEQTARVLETARQGAAEMRSSAEEHAARVTATADADATETRQAAAEYDAATRAAADDYAHTTRHAADDAAEVARAEAVDASETMRAQAASILEERTAEAEAASAAIRAEADSYTSATRAEADNYGATTRSDADAYRDSEREAGDAYRAEAEAEGDRLRSAIASEAATARAAIAAESSDSRDAAEVDAEAIRDAARREGRAMVDEARDYRERVIADLADRRRAARAQLDQLAASRDALAVTLTDVAGRIDASYQAISGTVIDPRTLGDVSADRAALGERPLPELLEDPLPEEDTVPADAGPDDLDEPVEAHAEPEPEPPEPDEIRGDGGPVAPDEVIEIFEVLEVVEIDLDVDDGASTDDAGAVDTDGGELPAAGSDVGPDDDDPADALFAQLKAATDPDEPLAPAAGEETAPREPVDVSPSDAPASSEPEPSNPGPHGEGDVEPAADPDADLLDRRDAATDEIERQLAKRLKRVLSDEQNEALDRLRRVRGEIRADDVLASEADHRERYRAAAAEDLAEAERAGAGFFGPAPAQAAEIDDVAETFAADLVRALRVRLDAAFDDGGDEQEIGERIRACYREWKTQRIAEVARHSVQLAFGRGVAAYEADTPTRWVVDHGGEAAPDCDDNALAGVVAPGEPFATGDRHPPIHPGCRCLTVPVAD